jgi:hypothetical protein
VINGLRLSEWLERTSPLTVAEKEAIGASGPAAGRYLGYVIRQNPPLAENSVVEFIHHRLGISSWLARKISQLSGASLLRSC